MRGTAAPGQDMHADRRRHPSTVAVSSASEHSTPACPVPHLYLRWLGYGIGAPQSRISDHSRTRHFATNPATNARPPSSKEGARQDQRDCRDSTTLPYAHTWYRGQRPGGRSAGRAADADVEGGAEPLTYNPCDPSSACCRLVNCPVLLFAETGTRGGWCASAARLTLARANPVCSGAAIAGA